MGQRVELSPTQIAALTLLAGGLRDREVAEQVGTDAKQIWRWRNENPVFAEHLADMQAELWRGARQRLLGACNDAVDCLISVCRNADAPAAARVAAAKDILDRAGLVAEKDQGVSMSQAEFDLVVDKLANERVAALKVAQ